ncbi:GfV-B23-ORF2 [Ichnoviriform fumiferanae]|uniref:GfV-B23-ORF2 n=1 Tax=Ichnoviriform fumiferanae TaxID=419435 RepID=A2PZS1_9VIRU|nr:GfV-B23-ORF2 [Ichnoviriform fumiferanae]BAF45493.1 GfV-B23-ORF2 [Ichnoviriform fumiferanae]
MEHLHCSVAPSQECYSGINEIHDIEKYDRLPSAPMIEEIVEESNICENNISRMEEGRTVSVEQARRIISCAIDCGTCCGYIIGVGIVIGILALFFIALGYLL